MKLFSRPASSKTSQFSNEVKEIISRSREVAIDCQNTFIDNDHFLLAIMHDESETSARKYLTNIDDQPKIEQYLLDSLMRYRVIGSSKMIPLTQDAETALKHINQETSANILESSHLLLSMLRNREYPFAALNYEVVKAYFEKE